MFKKVLIGAILLTSLFLSACATESRTNKEIVVDSFQTITDSESYDATSSIKFDLGANSQIPDLNMLAQILNDSETYLDQHMDSERGLFEIVLRQKATIGAISVDSDLAVLLDYKNDKILLDIDNLAKNYGFGIPQELSNKLIDVDLTQFDSDFQGDTIAKAGKDLTTAMSDFLKEKGEENFSKTEDGYLITLNKDDIIEYLSILANKMGDTLTEEQMQDINEIELNTFEIYTKLNGDQVESHKFVIDLVFFLDGQIIEFGVTVDTKYNSMNDGVEFKIKPEEKESIKFSEIEHLISNY